MKTFSIFLTLLMLVTGTAAAQDNDAKYAAGLLKPGTQAPEFTISGTDNTAGKALKDLRGKYVVLDFWATWCPDCRKEIPAMKALYEEYASKGIEFVGVSFDKDPTVLDKYVKENGIRWMQHCEYKPWKETRISADYNIKWIPSIYLLDREGRVMLATVMTDKLREKLAEITSCAICPGHETQCNRDTHHRNSQNCCQDNSNTANSHCHKK